MSDIDLQSIYEEVKTPFKVGMALMPEEGEMLDNPMVFRHCGAWFMMFIRFDGRSYETHLAKSDDPTRSCGGRFVNFYNLQRQAA